MQQTNCHPFRHENWLWMHNGAIRDFAMVKRDLTLAVDPALYPSIEGTTDSEVHLLPGPHLRARGRPAGGRRADGRLRSRRPARAHGVEYPIQMTVATTDGDTDLGVPLLQRGPARGRCSTARDIEDPAAAAPGQPRRCTSSPTSRGSCVSEPLGDLEGAWNEVPESSCGVVRAGRDGLAPSAAPPRAACVQAVASAS